MNFTTKTWRVEEGLDTPYKKAAQEWDERLGHARVQAKNWRLAALLSITGLTLSTFGWMYVGSMPKLEPHIVAIDELGNTAYLGSVTQSYEDFTPTQALIKTSISNFILWTRGLSSDPMVIRNHWDNAYAYIHPEAHMKLSNYARDNDPYLRSQKERVDIQINNISSVSETTFQVDWQETVLSPKGETFGVYSMRGMFTLTLDKPTSEAQLKRNPIGLFVKSFSWSEVRT